MLKNDYSMEPVIVDFGLSTNVDLEQYLFYRCGTPGYVAP
jgi:serine/threonine protein kinase